jgi:predicted RNA-binding protein with PUA-like domain
MKAEPESRFEKGIDVKFSIDDLQNATVPEPWNGVRNHQAKNNMQAMKKGDLAFFYHSSCKVPGVVGIMEIVEEATPDESAFDENDPYYDEKSDRENPKWFNVKVAFRTKFAKPETVTLDALRKHSVPGQALENMQLFTLSRLSVSKVAPSEWNSILDLAGEAEPQSLTVGDEVQATAADEDSSILEADADAVDGADASLIDAQGVAEQDESLVEITGDVLHDVVDGIAESAAEAISEEVAIELAEEIREELGEDVAEEVQAEIADEVAEQVEEIVAGQVEGAIAEEIKEVIEEEIAEAVEQAVIDEVKETIETIEAGQGIGKLFLSRKNARKIADT